MELISHDEYDNSLESYRTTLSFLARTVQEGRRAIIDGADVVIDDIQNMLRLLDNPKDDYEIEAAAHVARAIEPMQQKIELFVRESVQDFNVFLGEHPHRFHVQLEDLGVVVPLNELTVVGEAEASDIALIHGDKTHVFSRGDYKLLVDSSTME